MSEWIADFPDDLEDYFGFVYQIIDVQTGRYYIGKKFLWKTVKMSQKKGRSKKEKEDIIKKLKKNKTGKLRTRYKKKESDWKEYWGSSNELLNDVYLYGEDRFERRILLFCKSKSECAYEELKEQMRRDVLDDPLSYNGIINVRLSKICRK